MRKIKFYVNNVETLESKLHLKKSLKRIRLRKLFSERRLREILDKIPKDFSEEKIKSFEKETGIVLKYYVYEHSYDFREYTKLGIYPDPRFNAKDGIDYKEFRKTYLDNYDILVVINNKKLYIND